MNWFVDFAILSGWQCQGTPAALAVSTARWGRQEIREPPTAVMDMLGSLTIKCTNCHNSVKATRYLSHMKSKCEKDMMVTTPYELTVGEIIESITPPTAVEKKAAGRIIKRLMTQNSTAIIEVPTSGQVK